MLFCFPRGILGCGARGTRGSSLVTLEVDGLEDGEGGGLSNCCLSGEEFVAACVFVSSGGFVCVAGVRCLPAALVLFFSFLFFYFVPPSGVVFSRLLECTSIAFFFSIPVL